MYMAGDTERDKGTRGLVAMTSAQHAEGCQFDPGRVYAMSTVGLADAKQELACCKAILHCRDVYYRLLLLSRAPLLGTASASEQPMPSPARRAAPIWRMGHQTAPPVMYTAGAAGTQLRRTAHA